MSGWEDHSDADDDGNSVFGEAPLPPANIQQVAEQIAQGLLNLDESMEPADDEFDNPDSYSVELPVEDSVPDEDFLPIGDAPPDDDPGLEMLPPVTISSAPCSLSGGSGVWGAFRGWSEVFSCGVNSQNWSR
ncbi:hypothetical protein VC83_02302 [Pseudogymnoascus destructans]|uniref:Uncharacterized protein n=1 Tax=Pseudogymnoascus destructans TaxID=655981 RepID=A0A177AG21_9PEZI|nr:uncharacterized protein VC83_02302 [Pseudogymnoascus destructans]OAF61069.1 hypothetical protein VC83_02302 [Pseudogymnoascus destructans]